MKKLLLVGALLFLARPAFAVDLQVKNGPGWNCFQMDQTKLPYQICLNCQLHGYDFDYNESAQLGHCVAKGGGKLSDEVIDKLPRPWGALAVGINEAGNRMKGGAAFNMLTDNTKQASTAALNECQEAEGENLTCKAVATFTGCGWIAVVAEGSSRPSWGVGASEEEAQEQCQRNGVSCKPAVGGCNRDMGSDLPKQNVKPMAGP